MTFHHDRLLKADSFSSSEATANLTDVARELRMAMAKGAKGHFPEEDITVAGSFNHTLGKTV